MRRCLVLLAATAALALAPATAFADGDPASDVLLLQDSYLPYAPRPSTGAGKALDTVLQETKRKGFNLKVAIIASEQDLGSVPNLFGKPQNYALFLEREIAFNSKKPLLVVMPGGFGVTEAGPGAAAAIKGIKAPGTNPDDMVRSAIDGAVAIAKANGKPVAKPNVPGGGGSSSSSPLLIFGVPVLLLALAGILMTLKRRESEPDEART